MRAITVLCFPALAAAACALRGSAAAGTPDALSELRALPAEVIRADERRVHARAPWRSLEGRRDETNRRDREVWRSLGGRADWEGLRGGRLAALRRALRVPDASTPAAAPAAAPPAARVTGVVEGDGYRIEKTLFASRPGLWVAAHVYVPEGSGAPRSRPALLLVHSHHRPKEEGELQDMGRLWARAGCVVLVMDQLGHGERADHPFRRAEDWHGEFRPSRQDYYFRYDLDLQLSLLGESLLGWMVHDLRVAVDLLLARADVDPRRLAILGAVAGGGDPAATAAALDDRIAAAVPFNFGGPQPETRFPLAADAETTFDYLGGAYWESTRNPRGEAAGGFLDWVIVASIAPRRLVYGHEFSWDRERDPVWRRLETIWSWYGAREALDFTHGSGVLSGEPPEASHCTNIGPVHRRRLHAALGRWFAVRDVEDTDSPERRAAAELRVWTDEARGELAPRSAHEILAGIAAERAAALRSTLAAERPAERRARTRALWREALGAVEPPPAARVLERTTDAGMVAGATVERLVLETEPPVAVPALLLLPRNAARPPVALGIAQAGKESFLCERTAEVAALLAQRVAVFLPDLRATGETRAGEERDRQSAATALSVTALQFGDPLVAAQLRDLRALLGHLRAEEKVDGARLAVWGDSFAAENGVDTDFRTPHGVGGRPRGPEPLGAFLALLAGLFEDDLSAVVARGGVADWSSALASPFVYLPHDVVVPGALACGDAADLAGALAPLPLRVSRLADACGRRADGAARERFGEIAGAAYGALGRADALTFAPEVESAAAFAGWLGARLGARP
jgi:dienelactone hydrolase